MKYKGFDGRVHPLSVTDYFVYDNSRAAKSDLHLRARKLIKEMFPCDRILEEVTLPGSKKNGSILYSDFLIPSQNIMIEVHGEQHYKFIAHFHHTIAGFRQSKLRDNDKREWCELNEILLIELPFNEDDKQWRKRIESR